MQNERLLRLSSSLNVPFWLLCCVWLVETETVSLVVEVSGKILRCKNGFEQKLCPPLSPRYVPIPTLAWLNLGCGDCERDPQPVLHLPPLECGGT
jgi:hypothetical protein